MVDPILGLLAVAIVFGLLILGIGQTKRKTNKKLDLTYFQTRWTETQAKLKEKTTWPLAVINADKLLDEALKRRKFKGKTMGERMVSAQRELSDNDGAWFAHKLRNRLVHEADVTLKEADVKKALFGIRQAIRDLGAAIR